MMGYVVLPAVASGLFGYIWLAPSGRLDKRGRKLAREMVTWRQS